MTTTIVGSARRWVSLRAAPAETKATALAPDTGGGMTPALTTVVCGVESARLVTTTLRPWSRGTSSANVVRSVKLIPPILVPSPVTTRDSTRNHRYGGATTTELDRGAGWWPGPSD